MGFLGVTEPLLELELERRLVEKVKQFLLELGQGFTYIGNQHVLSYNGKDYKVDMLFFHRGLRSLVAVDLKISEFMPEYVSKMNRYLSLLDRLERGKDENPSKGFAFVARQQRIKTDMGEYYIDLVFYNYILKCFLLIDLKVSQIFYEDVGQMDMYIRMYDDLKCTEGDNPTIGLLLCSETSKDLARYSMLKDSKQLYAAKYLTYLPTKEELTAEIERQKEIFALQTGKNQD